MISEGFILDNKKSQKNLKRQYKERKVVGGVYLVRNTLNNKSLLDASVDLQGSKNRFDFAQKTGSCVDLKLQKDWANQHPSDFVFEVLEELEKGETQTDKEFSADIKALKEMWAEKLAGKNLY